MSPRTSFIVQFTGILFLRSFEISENIQSIKIVRLEPSSKLCFNYYLTPFRHVSLI